MKIKGWQWPQQRGGQGKDGNRHMLWVVPETHREGSTESHRASTVTRTPCQRSGSCRPGRAKAQHWALGVFFNHY